MRELPKERGPRQEINKALQTTVEGACQEGVDKKVPEDGRLEGESVLTAVSYSQRSQDDIYFLQATPPAPHQLPGKQSPSSWREGSTPPDCGPGYEGQRGENHRPREKSHLRESLPGQKVETPSKQEVGPRDTPITTPGDATEILSTGTEDEGADSRAHR